MMVLKIKPNRCPLIREIKISISRKEKVRNNLTSPFSPAGSSFAPCNGSRYTAWPPQPSA